MWLGGRPVAMVRGRLSNTWARQADTSTDCARNGEAAACGVYFPVTDHIGKPVLMLDGGGRVAGAADHEPFGHVNRVALNAETTHPLDSWYHHACLDDATDGWRGVGEDARPVPSAGHARGDGGVGG
ncbi:hypothetical protein [Archangium violaceum]|uniref:hypothetical protein n=1 Tax=Archangium violaceum TaxID=83451 RepID=UPI0037BF7A1E